MKKTQYENKKLNNKGFTLIEVLIAVVILAVAIIPMMYSFINAIKVNYKARELQQETALAHTIVENCKACSIDDLDKKMTSTYDFLDDVEGWYSDVDASDSRYVTYFMTGVEIENYKYDVSLKVSPKEFTSGGTSTNKYNMMQMSGMNLMMDAIFSADGGDDATIGNEITIADDGTETIGGEVKGAAHLDEEAYILALQTIADGIKGVASSNTNILTPEISLSEVENNLSSTDLKLYRNITIQAEKSGIYDVVTVTYQYSFELNTKKFTYDYDNMSDPTTPIEVVWNLPDGKDIGNKVVYKIYDNTNTYDASDAKKKSAVLENIYFFYYPAYKGTSSLCPITADNIKVVNNLGRDINIYVLKQKNTAYAEDILSNLEFNYSPTISGEVGTLGTKVIMYHNFDKNLSSWDGASTPASPTINDITLAETLSEMSTLSGETNSLVAEPEKTLMYDLEVSIYEYESYNVGTNSMDGEPLLTMDATALGW